MKRKILVMGLPGSGKTTLSKLLSVRLNAVHFNADEVRANINKDLGFSEEDRIEHARRMGWLCDQVVQVGGYAIADFICPTPATREAFSAGGDPFVIWVDRIKQGPFDDTNRMFVPPAECDIRVDRRARRNIGRSRRSSSCGRCSIRRTDRALPRALAAIP